MKSGTGSPSSSAEPPLCGFEVRKEKLQCSPLTQAPATVTMGSDFYWTSVLCFVGICGRMPGVAVGQFRENLRL